MADPVTALGQITLAAVQVQAKLLKELGATLAQMWGSFDGWYDDTAVTQIATESANLQAKTLTKVRALADASARKALSAVGVKSKPETAEPSYPRQGVSAQQVWERPAVQYRYQLSQGKPPAEALSLAVERVQSIVDTDAALIAREAKVQRMASAQKVTGYRRIIHPELSKSGVCGLCVVAADRVYSTDELMPIHDGCNCDIAPVTAAHDPGLSLNREDLEKLYAAAGGSDAGGDLARVRISSYEHGELGPVLVQKGAKYLTSEEAAMRAKGKTTGTWAERSRASTAASGGRKKAEGPKSRQQQITMLQGRIDGLDYMIKRHLERDGMEPTDNRVLALQWARKSALAQLKKLQAAA